MRLVPARATLLRLLDPLLRDLRPRARRRALQIAPPVFAGAAAQAELLVEQRRRQVRVGAQRVGAQRGLVVRERGLAAVVLLEDPGEIQVRLDVQRVAAQRLLVAGARRVAPIALVVDRAEIAVRVGEVGVGLEGASVGVRRLLEGLRTRVETAAAFEPLERRLGIRLGGGSGLRSSATSSGRAGSSAKSITICPDGS